MRARTVLVGALLGVCLAVTAFAQDAVKVDSKHYSVISENAQVRILRVHYGAHEKSVMHSHPATVAVFLTDANGTFHTPDGKTQDFSVKAGDAQYSPAGVHLPENKGDAGMDVIVIELKHPHAAMGMDHMKSMDKMDKPMEMEKK